ncbi:MAG: class I SAM-dependent methyltransferase [Patescibacteria group bacterium]
MHTNNCQLCSSANLELAIDLGHHPLADTFLPPDKLDAAETSFPLRTLLCRNCGYMTLQYIVPSETRYQQVDYSYTSANSPVAVKHFAEMAQQLSALANLGNADLVVDIGSSDGTLLKAFKEQTRCRILGIEPAPNIAKMANEAGVPTLQDFFNAKIKDEIVKQGKAKIITANNVFNHINDLRDFMSNIVASLADGGLFVFEVPSLYELVKRSAFDTIYLEHVSYFGIKPLRKFFSGFGLAIKDIRENDYMGGSMRVAISHLPENTKTVDAVIAKEENTNIYSPETYVKFMDQIRRFKFDLCLKLFQIKSAGGKIIGIGAATKGNTLLNFCKIDNSLLDCVTDTSALKIGKYLPGSHLRIIDDKNIPPDTTHALILPWNIGHFLKKKLKHLEFEFIIPSMGK